MASITFETHKFIRKLETAGFTPQQAEVVADAFQDASAAAEVATKRDVEQLEARMVTRFEQINGKLTVVQWMVALIVAAEVVPLMAQLFR